MNAFSYCSRLHIYILLMFVSVCLYTGCQSGPALPANAVRVTQDQNNQSVTLASGQTLVIELQGNPSTGYTWQMVQMPNQAVLLPDGTKEANSSAYGNDSNVETQYIRFVATQPGETNVSLNYVRPNLGPNESTPTFSIHIEVTP